MIFMLYILSKTTWPKEVILMKVLTYSSYKHVDKSDFLDKVSIVIDMLCTTTTITTVLSKGCAMVIPVEKREDAFKLKTELSTDLDVICGGERDGVKLEGFDYANMPLEYDRKFIKDKCLILCTTNGTKAITKAVFSKALLIGCMNNAMAVSRKAVEMTDKNNDIILLCAGNRGQFSADDVITAGAIISRIKEEIKIDDMDDLSHTALWLYERNKDNLHHFLCKCRSYRIIENLKQKENIDYCFMEDISDTVPIYKDGIIK